MGDAACPSFVRRPRKHAAQPTKQPHALTVRLGRTRRQEGAIDPARTQECKLALIEERALRYDAEHRKEREGSQQHAQARAAWTASQASI